jgi:hypothetical protein
MFGNRTKNRSRMKEYGVGIVTAAHFILCYCGMREANGESKERTPSAQAAGKPGSSSRVV